MTCSRSGLCHLLPAVAFAVAFASVPAIAQPPIFKAVTDYTAQDWPEALTTGDFTNDGFIDIAVGHFSDRTVLLLVGQGDGTFATGSSTALAGGVRGLTSANLDGDANLDLIATTYDGAYIFMGRGDGTFDVSGPLGEDGSSTTAGKIDTDASIDFVLSKFGNTIVTFFGNGDGSFVRGDELTVGDDPDQSVIADFDGDGANDIAVGNLGDGTASILLGNGDGSFGTATSISAGQIPRSLLTSDLNGDGNLDLALVTYFRVSVLLGNGDGSFAPKVEYGAGYQGLLSLAAGDFDQDGDIDLAASQTNTPANSYGAYRAFVFRNSGSGTFSSNPESIRVGTEPRAIVSDDFNGDGKLDLATANRVSDSVSIVLGRGSDGFERAVARYPGYSPAGVALGDVDDDGILDAVVTHYHSDGVSVNPGLNGSSFRFGSGPGYDVGDGPDSVVLADLDGDTALDIITANLRSDDVSVLLGNGDGTFRDSTAFAAGEYPLALNVGDMNGDDSPDIVVTNINSTVSVLINNGDGTLQAARETAVTDAPRAGALGDLDGDGKLDLVVASADTADGIFILRGGGDGYFSSIHEINGPNSRCVALGHMNGDGDLDIVVADFRSTNVWVFPGGPGTSFGSPVLTSAGQDPDCLALGDLDGNGAVDVVVTVQKFPPALSDEPLVYELVHMRGNGNGTLSLVNRYASAGSTGAPVVGDVEGDGDLDVAVTTLDGNALWLFPNRSQEVDLVLSKDGPATVESGQQFAYRIDVYNRGPITTRGVVVTDVLPDGVTFVGGEVRSYFCTEEPDGTQTCGGEYDPFACMADANVVTCDIGDLIDTASAVVSIFVEVAPGATGSVTNVASVSGSVVDSDTSNNEDSATSEVVDTTPPVLTVPGDMNVQATGPDGATVHYVASADDSVDGPVTPVCSPASGSVFPLGDTTVTCTATDAAGNSATASFIVSVYDGTPPVITASVTGTLGTNGWYVSDVGLSWTVEDPETAISDTNGCGDTSVVTDTAEIILTCTATSEGGTASSSVTIKRDTTPPAPSFGAPFPAPNAAGWHNTDISISYTCLDDTSGSDQAGLIEVSTEGAGQTVTMTCVDLAGNSGSGTSAPFDIDKTLPFITIGSPVDGAVLILNERVASEYSCSDGLSGVDLCAGPVASGEDIDTLVLDAREFTVNSTDVAGNVSTLTHHYYVITVPEAIANLIAVVESYELHHGTENSLIAKLENAIKTLEDGNPGNDGAAAADLEAFKNEVEAQRGKKITGPQADYLIAEADRILTLLYSM